MHDMNARVNLNRNAFQTETKIEEYVNGPHLFLSLIPSCGTEGSNLILNVRHLKQASKSDRSEFGTKRHKRRMMKESSYRTKSPTVT